MNEKSKSKQEINSGIAGHPEEHKLPATITEMLVLPERLGAQFSSLFVRAVFCFDARIVNAGRKVRR